MIAKKFYVGHHPVLRIYQNRKIIWQLGEPMQKLGTPVIFLDDGVTPEYDTTAILGKAILGHAILGTSISLPKLDAPAIRLDVIADGGEVESKLSAPVIRIEEEAEQLTAPTNLQFDYETLTLSWDASKMATYYTVVIAGFSIDTTEAQLNAYEILADTWENYKELLDGTNASVFVLAFDADGNMAESESITIDVAEAAKHFPKLDAHVIELEVIPEEGGEPVPEPDPEPVALDTPVIYLHVEECLHASYTSSVTSEPTCTADGKRTLVCSECGYTWTEPIPAIGHNYSSVIVTPTCTEGGYTTHTCANCGDTYIDSQTAALGHDWGESYYSDTFATGYGHVCNRCGEKESLEPPMAKLDAPVIYLEETAKLDAPVISIEEVIEELTAPTNFQYDYETSMFSWDSVKGATKYRLWFVGMGSAPVVETQFDVEPGFLPYIAEMYGYSDGDKLSVSIEAEDDDGNVSERTVIYIDVEEARKYLPKLDAPSITLE